MVGHVRAASSYQPVESGTGTARDTYRFLHITDAHLLLCDEDETQERIDYAAPRIRFFSKDGIPTERRLSALLAYAAQLQPALSGVLLTGDILDFPSERNRSFLRQALADLPVPYFYVPGNHDWAYFDDYQTAHAQVAFRPLFGEFCDGNTFVHKRRIGELTLVGVDNGREMYEDGVAETLAEALSGERHVLLLQHIPLCAVTLHEPTMAYWGGQDLNIGKQGKHKNEHWKAVRQLITAPDSPVRAVLAGHLHFFHTDLLDGRVPQIVTAFAADGSATLLTVHG